MLFGGENITVRGLARDSSCQELEVRLPHPGVDSLYFRYSPYMTGEGDGRHLGYFENENAVTVFSAREGLELPAGIFQESEFIMSLVMRDGIPTPSLDNFANGDCIEDRNLVLLNSWNEVTPISWEIREYDRVVSVRAGDFNEDGLVDLVYDMQVTNQILYSTILYRSAIPEDDENYLCGWQNYQHLERIIGHVEQELGNQPVEKLEALQNFLSTLYIKFEHYRLRPPDEGCYTDMFDNLLVNSFIVIGQQLSAQEIRTLEYLSLNPYVSGGLDVFAHYQTIASSIEGLIRESSAEELFNNLYDLLGGDPELPAEVMAQNLPLINQINYEASCRLLPRDILAVVNSIGMEGARVLANRFGITRFDRYRPAMLSHLLQMATDVNHDQEKPLIFMITAEIDQNNAFYGGGNLIEYDDRVRFAAAEVETWDNLVRSVWSLRNTYGIPDIVFIAAHGRTYGFQLSAQDVDVLLADLVENHMHDFDGFFVDDQGIDRGGQIITNMCSAGVPPEQGATTVAQFFADAFHAEAIAARSIEVFERLNIIVENGRARAIPIFFEIRSGEYFGINRGETRFYPNEEHVYQRAAQTNNGLGPFISVDTNFQGAHVVGGVSYTMSPHELIRLRFDFAEQVSLRGEIGFFIAGQLDIGFGPINHLLGTIRASAGLEVDPREHSLRMYMDAYAGVTVLLPRVDVELNTGFLYHQYNEWPVFTIGLRKIF